MIPTLEPRRRRLAALCLTAGVLAGVGAPPVAGASASPARGPSAADRPGAGSPRQYPAGATRPALRPRRSEYARPRRSAHGSSSGGSSAPGAPPPTASAHRRPPKSKRPVLHGDPARALLAFQAMQSTYYIPGSGLYAGEPFSYLWPFSQALAATVTLSNIPRLGVSLRPALNAELTGLNAYLDANNAGAAEGTYTSTLPAFDGTAAPPVGPGGAKYYDDNDWVGIELVRLYELTHSPALLGSAEGIMAFEMAGWEPSPELGCPGGLPFSNTPENSTRNTVTTAPAAELGVQLYKLTGNVAYLQFAEMAYEWVRRCLLQANGLYADHINRRGVVEATFWSYNQGTMIGAGTLLYQATGNAAFLYQARQSARASLAYLTPERLGGEIPFFPSIYFRNLLYLDSVTHDPPGPRIAQAYVDYAWQHLRLADNVFVAGSPAAAQLLVQSAIVQIYGLLSSPASTYF